MHRLSRKTHIRVASLRSGRIVSPSGNARLAIHDTSIPKTMRTTISALSVLAVTASTLAGTTPIKPKQIIATGLVYPT